MPWGARRPRKGRSAIPAAGSPHPWLVPGAAATAGAAWRSRRAGTGRGTSGERRMIISTTDSIEGRRIAGYLGVVSGDAVMGANVFRDMFAGLRDIVGGRSGAYEKELKQAKQLALEEMIEEATGTGRGCDRWRRSRLRTPGQRGAFHADGQRQRHRGQADLIPSDKDCNFIAMVAPAPVRGHPSANPNGSAAPAAALASITPHVSGRPKARRPRFAYPSHPATQTGGPRSSRNGRSRRRSTRAAFPRERLQVECRAGCSLTMLMYLQRCCHHCFD